MTVALNCLARVNTAILLKCLLLVASILFIGCSPPASTDLDFDATKKLAESNDANAQCDLGRMYYKGQGVPQNYVEALKWFFLAAVQGIAEAQCDLGGMYYAGEGTPRDTVEAYAWYSVAAAGGDPHAARARDIVARQLFSHQVPQGQKRATELFEKYGSGKF